MSPDKLVYMANQMARFFDSAARADAPARIAAHINDFWEPRMRRALIVHVAQGDAGLLPSVSDALPLIHLPQEAE